MKQSNKINERIFSVPLLQSQIKWWRLINKKIAFTNGVSNTRYNRGINTSSSSLSSSFGLDDVEDDDCLLSAPLE